MATPSDYITGTISLTNGSASFTGTATGWALAGFREGDTIIDITGATEYMGVIASIDANGAGTLTKPWEGPTQTDVAYRMRYQPDGSRVTAQARQLIELLGNGNLQALAGLEGSANRIPMFIAPGVMQLVARTDLTSGVNYDAQVNAMAGRAAYNGADEGFAVLVSNTGDGRAAVYVKVSNASGDWSEPAYVTGPAVTLDVGSVDTVPFGSEPDVTLSSVPGGYEFDFELPAPAMFQSGTITTLDPGQPATFDLVPVTGGYALNLGVPRGPTGNISGVTSFWQNRITVDTTQEAVLSGLGALGRAATLLTSSDDIDSLTVPGLYRWLTSVPANVPDNRNGLKTFGFLRHYDGRPDQASNAAQELTFWGTSDRQWRMKSAATWRDWERYWTNSNLPVGTQAEWEAGTGTSPRAIRPDRLAQAIQALAPAVPADVYRRSNIIGTVSQAGGVPTGGVIERGSNANGEYVRLADGTQICAVVRSHTTTGSWTALGSTGIVWWLVPTWLFPATFISQPYVNLTSGIYAFLRPSPLVSTTAAEQLPSSEKTQYLKRPVSAG
jgi:hypothetical protein